MDSTWRFAFVVFGTIVCSFIGLKKICPLSSDCKIDHPRSPLSLHEVHTDFAEGSQVEEQVPQI